MNCPHGIELDYDFCLECFRRSEMEAEAEREAWWQRHVMGPMLGFDQENDDERH